jgi:carbon storage regulator
MLVLSRQRDETIMIGDNIEITIVDIRGDKVRLGITAPATIPVHRKEVYEAIQRENREASKVKMDDFTGLPKPPGKSSGIPPGVRPHTQLPRPGTPQEGTPGASPESKVVPPKNSGGGAGPESQPGSSLPPNG